MRFLAIFATTILFTLGNVGLGFAGEYSVSNVTELQQALTEAESNGEDDTIHIASGHYMVTQGLHFSGEDKRALTIQGEGASNTVLDGDGKVSRILSVGGVGTNADVEISGITFENAANNGGYGAGLYINKGGGCSVTISDNTFANNSGWSCTGVWANIDSGTVRFYYNTFSDNTATSSAGGAGVNTKTGSVEFIGNRFLHNNADYGAGGLGVYSTSGSIVLSYNLFRSNSSSSFGGGAYLTSSGPINVSDNIFMGNEAFGNGGGLKISASVGDVVIRGNIFNNNIITTKGYYDTFVGAGLAAGASSGAIKIIRNIFSKNLATAGNSGGSCSGGGAAVASGSGSIFVINNMFFNNSAFSDGGGLYINVGHDIDLINNTFTKNTTNRTGGGTWIDIWDDTSVTNIYNNLWWDNSADNQADDFYLHLGGYSGNTNAILNLYYNNFSENADVSSGSSEDLVIIWSDNFNYGLNTQVDPQFQDIANGNLHLSNTSPCIDAGDSNAPSLSELDLDGYPRKLDGNGDGVVKVDIGAFEYGGADADGDGMPDGWEAYYQLNTSVNDGLLDLDSDGFSNFREYLSKTNPNDDAEIPPIVANFDQDEDSDGLDLGIFIAEWDRHDCSEENPCNCDLDGDGDVDVVDLIFFGEDFGRTSRDDGFPEVPEAPSNLRIGSSGAGTLEWDTVPNATGYKLYWGVNVGTYSSNIDVGNVTQYDLNSLSLQSGVTYYLAVTAYDYVGESAYSLPVSWTKEDDTPPPPPR